MTTPKKLGEVEADAANVGGERREGLRALVSGRAVFLFMREPRTFPNRDGVGTVSVASVLVWSPRTGKLWLDIRGEHIAVCQGLAEGALLRFAGQLVIVERGITRFTTVRVWELERI